MTKQYCSSTNIWENWNIYLQKNLYTSVHSIIIHDSQKIETQMSVIKWNEVLLHTTTQMNLENIVQ